MADSVPGAIMRKAGLVVADEARKLAARWSRQIPPSIRVVARGNTVTVTSAVGPAYPNEVIRVRHPVFGYGSTGNEWSLLHKPNPPWVTNAHRPFLQPAADAKADAAAAEIAKAIDDAARKDGFR